MNPREDPMGSYANVFLQQGVDNLLIALKCMSHHVHLAGLFLSISIPKNVSCFLQVLFYEILISKAV